MEALLIPIAVALITCLITGFLIGRKGNSSNFDSLVYDFEDSCSGRVMWNYFKGLSKEDRVMRFPPMLKKGSGLVLPPGLRAYLLKDIALINSPSGEFIQGTVESTHDEAAGD